MPLISPAPVNARIRIRPPGAGGAYAVEDLSSRVGMESGIWGVKNASRLFHVHLAAPGDNPFYTIRHLTSNDGGVQEGSIFPWDDGAQVLGFFTIEECRTSTYYMLRAHYIPRIWYIPEATNSLWDVELTTALETEHVLTDATGKGVGTPTYRNTLINNETADFYADSERQVTSLYIRGHQSPLGRDLPRHLEGMDRDKPVGTITATKKIPRWNMTAIAAAARFTNSLNSEESFTINSIFGRIPMTHGPGGVGKVKFQGVRVTKAQQSGTDGSTEVACQVTCVFKFNADGFDERRPHKHKFDGGEEAPVLWLNPNLLANAQQTDLVLNRPEFGKQVDDQTQVGDQVQEKFIRYPSRINLSGLLEQFA